MKYLKKFNTHSEYEEVRQNLVLPNVSLCAQENEVHYNPIVPPIQPLMVTYNVEDASNPTQLYNYNPKSQVIGVDMFDKVEIDGTEVSVADLDTNNGSYQLSVGEHTVTYTLKDPTIIANYAFDYCKSLTSVTIPNSVTSIGIYAFRDCTSLTSVTIPNSVTTIGQNAFTMTPWWNTYSADTSHRYDNIIYINDVAYEAVSTAITSCELKNGTVSIGGSAFYDCSSLTSVTIPSSVTSIGINAFYNCTSLASITSLATTAPTIQSNTFQNVKSNGTLYVPSDSSGYDTWMQSSNYYLGSGNWTKVEQ